MNRQVPDKEKIFAIFVPEKDMYTEYIAKEPIQLNKKAAQIKKWDCQYLVLASAGEKKGV